MKITAKVYTGKNAKTYKLKTNKDGNAVLNTKGIKVGKHKVKITFNGNKNFKKSSAQTSIEVSKKIPTLSADVLSLNCLKKKVISD